MVPPGLRANDPDRFEAEGAIASTKGRYADATKAFRKTRIENDCASCGLYDLAESYIKNSQPDSARITLEKFENGGGTFRVYQDALYLAATYQRLGELYEEKGDRKRAVQSYEKLLDLWKNADPELQPIVKDVKQRVERLNAGQS